MIKEKVIIDTDIGDDIDDTLALILAVNSPEIDVIGVATVYKNTLFRAKIARHILNVLGKQEIDVAAGENYPLEKKLNPFFNQNMINDIPRQFTNYVNKEEINFLDSTEFYLRKMSSSNGLVTIISMGPLTNIATLLTKHPKIKDKIKRIIVMGGAYYLNQKEYNIVSDAIAAKVVFESGIDILAVGLDVSSKCQLKKEDLEQIKNHGSIISNKLYGMIIKFMNYRNHIPYLHDPLAVAVAINQSLVTTQKQNILIETKSEITVGFTLNVSNIKWWKNKENTPLVNVCKEVNRDQFVKLLLNRILI